MESLSYRQEALYFHESLFGRPPDESFIEAYSRAHAEIPELKDLSAAQSESLRKIVLERLSAVGIEPWLRKKDRRHPLTSKLLLVAYLSECDAKHSEFNRHNHDIKNPLLNIVGSGIRGVMVMMWGLLQKLHHGVV